MRRVGGSGSPVRGDADLSVMSVISGRQLKRTVGGIVPNPRFVYTHILFLTQYSPLMYLLPR